MDLSDALPSRVHIVREQKGHDTTLPVVFFFVAGLMMALLMFFISNGKPRVFSY